MDNKRFDSLSKRLAERSTRRTVLGGLAAGVLGVFGVRAADAGAQQVTQAYCGSVRCRANPEKCREGCVCCVYSNGNSRCTPPGQCNGGGAIVGGTTTTTTTTQGPPICSGFCNDETACDPGCFCFIGFCS